MIISSSYVVLIDDEVFRLVSRVFNKSLVTVQPDSVPAPYNSENPPSVGIFVFIGLLFFSYW
jgi:hypothetical protein